MHKQYRKVILISYLLIVVILGPLLSIGISHASPTINGTDEEWSNAGGDSADCDWKSSSLIVCDNDTEFRYNYSATVAAGHVIFSLVNTSSEWSDKSDLTPSETWYIHLTEGKTESGILNTSATDGSAGQKIDTITSDNEGGNNLELATGSGNSKEAPEDYDPQGTDTKEPGDFQEQSETHGYGGQAVFKVCGLYTRTGQRCYDLSNNSDIKASNKDGSTTLITASDPNITKLNTELRQYKKSRDKCGEDSGSLSFIFCPLLEYTRDAASKLIGSDGSGRGFIIELLTISPLSQTGSNKALYDIWKAFRDVALGLFILIFMIIIFGNGLGIEAYTIKRALPRLALGALFTFASFYILQTLIDITNLLGNAIPALLTQITNNANISGYNIDLSGGLQGVGIILMIVFALLALIAVLVGIAGLIARQLIIFMLVLSAPFAFVMWVLPNTENLFKKWWSNLIRVLFMFPMITGMIAMSLVFQATTASSSSNVVKLAGTLAPLVALMMIPKTFKWGGEAFAAAAGFTAGYAAKAGDWGKGAAKKGATKGWDRSQDRLAQTKFGATKVGGFVSGAGVGSLVGTRGSKLRRMSQLNRISSDAEKAVSYDYDNTMAKVAADGRKAGLTSDQIEVKKAAAYQRMLSKAPSQDRALYAKKAVQSGNRDQVQMAAVAMGQQNYEEFVSRNFGDFDSMADMRKFNVASQRGTASGGAAIQSELRGMGAKGLLSGNGATQKEWFGSYDATSGTAKPAVANIRSMDQAQLNNALGDRSNRNNLTQASLKALQQYAYDPSNRGDAHAAVIRSHLDNNGMWTT